MKPLILNYGSNHRVFLELEGRNSNLSVNARWLNVGQKKKQKKNTHTQQTLNKTQWRWKKKTKCAQKTKRKTLTWWNSSGNDKLTEQKTSNSKHVSTVLNETWLKHTLYCMFFFPKTMSQGTKLKQKDVSNSFRLN